MKDLCVQELKKLTGKKYITFTKRGNASIKAALKLVKSLGYKKVLLQDQGGWMTYTQFIKKLKLDEERIKTDYGLVDLEYLDGHEDSVFLLNSMPGYHSAHDMEDVEEACLTNNLLLINDVSGSIGRKAAKKGHMVLGSFGKWKPINLKSGGFLATDNKDYHEFFKEFEKELDFEKLYEKLEELDERLAYLHKTSQAIKEDLKEEDIIHRDHLGLVVIAKFDSKNKKKELINYCKKRDYEYVVCPKYIRVLDDAISIEAKRLEKL